MPVGGRNPRRQKLAKASLAKSNAISVEIGDIAGDTVSRLGSLSQSLGVTYDSNNNVVENATNDELDARQLHGIISGMNVSINANPRYFDIASGVYYVDGQRVEFAGTTVDTVSIVGGDFASAVIDNGGNITLIPSGFPTSTQLKDGYLEITAFSKTDANTINKIGDSFFVSLDFVKKIYLRHKLFEGTLFSGSAGAISANTVTPLQLDIAGGDLNSPNAEIKTILSDTNIVGQEIYRVGGVYEIQPQGILTINNTQYDNGNLTALANNKFVTHTVSRSTRTETIYLTIGDAEYNKVEDALNAPYNLGIFAGMDGSEIEPLANVIIEKDSATIYEIVDLRNGSSSATASSDISALESRVSAIEEVKWDDMKAPATGLNPAGRISPPDVDGTDGSLLFATGESIAIWFQLPHGWLEGSEIRPHLHWMKTTSATGFVDWRMTYKWANAGDVFPSFSASQSSTVAVSDNDTVDTHAISEFPTIDGTGKLISSMLCVVIERNATNDTYGADAKLLEMDIHYQIDSKGSVQEFIK